MADGHKTSPRRREAGRREQVRRDNDLSARAAGSRHTVSRADEKTGDARRAERHFSRSGKQCAVAEAARRDNDLSVRTVASR